MRLLLDECLSRRLKRDLPGHTVATVADMDWRGVKNGKLLRKAEGLFDVFLTADQNRTYQQNLQNVQIAIIVLFALSNNEKMLRPLMPKVLEVLQTIRMGEVVHVSL